MKCGKCGADKRKLEIAANPSYEWGGEPTPPMKATVEVCAACDGDAYPSLKEFLRRDEMTPEARAFRHGGRFPLRRFS